MTRRIVPRWLYLVTLAAVTWWLASPTTPDSFRVLAIGSCLAVILAAPSPQSHAPHRPALTEEDR